MASSTTIRTVDPVTHRGRVINTNTLLFQYNQALQQTERKVRALMAEGKPFNRQQILSEFLVGRGNPFDILNAVYSNGKLIQAKITQSKGSITNPLYATGVGQGGVSITDNSTGIAGITDLNVNAANLPTLNGIACDSFLHIENFNPNIGGDNLNVSNDGKFPTKESGYTQKRRVARNSQASYLISQAEETVRKQIAAAKAKGQPYNEEALYTAAIAGAFRFLMPNFNEVPPAINITANVPGSTSIITNNQRKNIVDVNDQLLRKVRLDYKNQLNVIDAKATQAALARYNKAVQRGLIPDVPAIPPPPSLPTVSITGGGGNGATATAAVISGMVINIEVLNQGSGYTSIPTVTISGGGGMGATATAVVMNGFVTSIDIVDEGTGYSIQEPLNPIFEQYLKEAKRQVIPPPIPSDPVPNLTIADLPGNMAIRKRNEQKRNAAIARSKIVSAAVKARTRAKQTWYNYLITPTQNNLTIANQALTRAQNATTLAFQTQGWRPPLNDTALDRETT